MLSLVWPKTLMTEIHDGGGGGCVESSRPVRPLLGLVTVTALAAIMASVTFFEFQSLTITKTTMASSNLQVKKRHNIERPLTTDDLLNITWKVRRQLADMGEKIEKNSTYLMSPTPAVFDSIYRNMTLDISPIYDIVDVAIDTLGVKGLYFLVFYDGKSWCLAWLGYIYRKPIDALCFCFVLFGIIPSRFMYY
jgi:hypothetical protein